MEEKINKMIDKMDMLLTALLQSKIAEPQQNTQCRYTLYSWLEEWFAVYKKPYLKTNSLKSIRLSIDRHIKPNIADIPLGEITGLDIQKALNNIAYSRTKKIAYHVYNGCMRQAKKIGLIANDVMVSVDSVKHKYKNGKGLTKEEEQQFINAIEKSKYKNLYLFYLASGCRFSEALGLEWTDVDYEKKVVCIRGTKTESSNRLIPLFAKLDTLLMRQSKINKRVFNYTPNAVKCNFKRLKKKHRFAFKLHDLRHTFATRCYEKGIREKTLQKWLGHSRIETTMNIYTHILSDFELAEVVKMDS